MDRDSRCTPRLLTLAVLMAAGMFAGGCEDRDSADYDPRIDGVVPHRVAAAEPGILDDQNKFHNRITPAPAPRSPGRTPEPAASRAGGGTPPPPETVAPPPPPPEEGTTAPKPAPEPAAPAPGG